MNSRAKALDGALRSVAQRCYDAAKSLPGGNAVDITNKLAALNDELDALEEMMASFVAHAAQPVLSGTEAAATSLENGGTD